MIPRCNRIRQGPNADLLLSSDELSGSENLVVGVLLVMPCESCLDEGYRNICPVDFDSGYEPSVPIPLFAFNANLPSEDEVRSELLCPLGEIRAGLRAIDSIQPNSCLLAAIVDGDRIAVRDADDLGVERSE